MNSKNIKILIKDSKYSGWTFVDADTNDDITSPNIPPNFHPLNNKFFTKDIFSVNEENQEITLLHSPVRNNQVLAGILVLENNKTYGRTSNKKHLLYKCIPDDTHLPHFLIPYDIKIGFSKKQINKYVIFQFKDWLSQHPTGTLVETIGNVDTVENFYQYQLYCKNLHFSLKKITDTARETLKQKPSYDEFVFQIFENPDYNIKDRRSETIFTIDPQSSTDFDDAFSIKLTADGNFQISVYIANVFFWLETLNLWTSFSKRVSTIYLPDHRRPMLPTILSDTLCSLQENQLRFAFAMDIIVDPSGNIIKPPTFENVLIKVSKNYVYEDPKLIFKNNHYKDLLRTLQTMDKNIHTSHDVVAFLMILINTQTANILETNQCGIFRSSTIIHPEDYLKKQAETEHLDQDTKRIIQNWNNTFGEYVVYNENSREHIIMNKKSYIHISSPIRRLVDLLNQTIFISEIPFSTKEKRTMVRTLSQDAKKFICEWIREIDYINLAMRSIRKVQIDCELMNRCFLDSNIMKVEHDGIIFDKVQKNDGTFSYMVYLSNYKLLSRITATVELDNYSTRKFNVFLFEDENKIAKKIRLQLVM